MRGIVTVEKVPSHNEGTVTFLKKMEKTKDEEAGYCFKSQPILMKRPTNLFWEDSES